MYSPMVERYCGGWYAGRGGPRDVDEVDGGEDEIESEEMSGGVGAVGAGEEKGDGAPKSG
jgi:hypothetical protein